MTEKKTAWIAGATGLVGGHLVAQLCREDRYDRIILLVRSVPNSPRFEHPKVTIFPVQFDALTLPDTLPADHIYCALGTTKRKTPDPQAYRQIDVDFPLAVARLGLQHGATHFALVSAHGANVRSFSGYLRLKGDLENELRTLDYPHLIIARPGLLQGQRQEFRLGEKIAEKITRFLPGNYRAIAAEDVAAAMIQCTLTSEDKVVYLSSASMQGRAGHPL